MVPYSICAWNTTVYNNNTVIVSVTNTVKTSYLLTLLAVCIIWLIWCFWKKEIVTLLSMHILYLTFIQNLWDILTILFMHDATHCDHKKKNNNYCSSCNDGPKEHHCVLWDFWFTLFKFFCLSDRTFVTCKTKNRQCITI